MPLAFAYHAKLAPMMWAFVAIAAVELFVVHLLVSQVWSVAAAGVLSALTLGSIVWLVALIRSFRRLPVMVDEAGLVMRAGMLNGIRIEAAQIDRLRRDFAGEALRRRGVLNLGLLSYPNLIVELTEPVKPRRGRAVTAVAHALEDADGFAAAVEALRARCSAI